jgi:hypothetical protein
MPEEKRPLKVFLSHAHSDADAMRALYERLTADGVDAWLDKEKLLPGQDWELEICKAVREADVVLVCLSRQFNRAGYRQKEVRWALDAAMEKPEGEIFIIPARLEECDNLESLKKWQWVDLFEDNGYERLVQALEACSRSLGIGFEIDESLLIEEHSTEILAPSSSVVNGLNWEVVSGSVIFYSRLCDAFPGLRGTERLYGKEAVDRLKILLRKPLKVARTGGPLEGQRIPFWWLRGRANLYFWEFERLDDDKVLIGNCEIKVNHIVAVREFYSEERDFVYLQAFPEEPIGLYKYPDGWLKGYLQKRLKKGHGYYFFEEYGLWKDHFITREEYDDGAAIIHGKPTQTKGAKLRLRYLTPYNIVLCGDDHVLNSISPQLDVDLTKLLDEMLLGTKTIEDLISFVDYLPRVKFQS